VLVVQVSISRSVWRFYGNIKVITQWVAIMTTTVKLPDSLEAALRQRCLHEGRSISEIMRDALSVYLAREPEMDSAWALGREVFGRHAGAANLAADRKQALAEVWDSRQAGRGA